MTSLSRPVSLVAERAVRFLRDQGTAVGSLRLASELLSTRASDESTARKILETAFGGDPRLVYRTGSWRLAETETPNGEGAAVGLEASRVLVFLEGDRPAARRPLELRSVSVLRLQGDDVVLACGGEVPTRSSAAELRATVTEALDGAVIVVHDPPGTLPAFERWLGEPIEAPISLRRLAQARLGLAAHHDLEALSARLGLPWRDSDDPLNHADALDGCLKALRKPGESLHDLRVASAAGARPIDWSRLAFDRTFLRRIPRVPGTYRFYDEDGRLLYVGKSKNLHQRIGSYFRVGQSRPSRVQKLLDRLYRIEYEHSGSELEAMLREAEQIRQRDPEKNVQRQFRVREGRGARLRSILILEPAEPPAVLRAYLIHNGRLIARIGLGPRGGGVKRVERLLEDYFFFAPEGPTPAAGPDLDVEVVVRWLAANRDRTVAFDPTTLQSAAEVAERLRWFLAEGSPFGPDGEPILTR